MSATILRAPFREAGHFQMPGLEDYLLPDCLPPADGGFLILDPWHINDWDFICLVKSKYPRTKIYVRQPIPVSEFVEQYHVKYADDRRHHAADAIGINVDSIKAALAHLRRNTT